MIVAIRGGTFQSSAGAVAYAAEKGALHCYGAGKSPLCRSAHRDCGA